MITVKVGKLPGKLTEVVLPDDSTVAQAVEAAGIKAAITPANVGAKGSYEVRVNAKSAADDAVLEEGDTILLVQKVKGN